MSGVGLNGADYLIEIIADTDEDLWRVVDESIRSLPGVEQTWWASTVSVEKESPSRRTKACAARRLPDWSVSDHPFSLFQAVLILKDESGNGRFQTSA